MTPIEFHIIKSNDDFGIVDDPVDHQQHPNQQEGLDRYIKVVNFQTGVVCFKKLYQNTKGLYFKHTGYSPMYLNEFSKKVKWVPFQILYEYE